MFVAVIGDQLCLVRGVDLQVVHRWPVPNSQQGWHGVWPEGLLALTSDTNSVSLREPDGTARWTLAHMAWSGSRESGCAWFDAYGRAFAVIPDPKSSTCLAVHVDVQTGRVLAQTPVDGEPAGIRPVPQHGWMGLSVGEGQDAARAWWIRVDDAGQLQVHDPKWTAAILADADAAGAHILTTPHSGDGPLTVRSFPDLLVVRTIPSPAGSSWLDTACFAGEHVIAQLQDEENERVVAIAPSGATRTLDVGEGSIVGAEHDSWLIAGRTRVARWSFVEG